MQITARGFDRLERLRGPDVFRVAALIQVELLALDRVQRAPATARPPCAVDARARRPPLSACTRCRARAPTPASRRSTASAPPRSARAETGTCRRSRDRAPRTPAGTTAAPRARSAATRETRADRAASRPAPARTGVSSAAIRSAAAAPRRAGAQLAGDRQRRRRDRRGDDRARPARSCGPRQYCSEAWTRLAGQLGAAVEPDQLDQECQRVDGAADLLDQRRPSPPRCRRWPAGRRRSARAALS